MRNLNRPVVFLDFDGVINNDATHCRPWPRTRAFSQDDMIEPRLRKRVGALVRAADANVVVSSTWREFFTLSRLREFLEPAIDPDRVIDVTPVFTDRRTRGDEIEAWLKARTHPPAHLVVLDDQHWGRFDMKAMRPWHVQTSERLGITGKDARRALHMLTHGPKWNAAKQAAA